jgi:hypothetical protein
LGNNSFNFNRYDDTTMETLNSYTNYAHLPHSLIISERKTNNIILKKTFESESKAFEYLHEAREFKNNKNRFSFKIVGPNCLYYV